jgi:uncharacterized protein (TIRG00374 family)
MSADRSQAKRTRLLAWLINLAGVAVFAFILYQGGWRVWQQIFRSEPLFLLGALTATLAWNLVAAYRWYLISKAVTEGHPGPSYPHYYTYHMIGMLTGQILPIGVGLLAGRPVALSLSGEVSLRRATLSVVLDKFFDLVLAALLAVPTALYLVDWIDLPTAAGAIVAAIVLGFLLIGWQYENTMRWLARLAARLARPFTRLPIVGRRLISRLPQQLERLSTETFVTNRRAVRLFLLTLVLYSLLALRLVFIALAVRLDVPWYLLAMGVGITQLTLIFSFTPGSLGILEGGWWAVFRLGGQPLDVYNLFVIARRALVLAFTPICALIGFAWIRESPARLFRAVLSASRRVPAATEPAAAAPDAGAAGKVEG